jgi:hypothetical protein
MPPADGTGSAGYCASSANLAVTLAVMRIKPG